MIFLGAQGEVEASERMNVREPLMVIFSEGGRTNAI
jgi:hypothetical protein